MPEYFRELPPDADLDEIASVIRAITKAIVKEQFTYPELADRVYALLGRRVSPDSIRMFVGRSDTAKINRSNQTLAILYDYMRVESRDLVEDARQIYNMNLSILIPDHQRDEITIYETTRSLALILQHWMYIDRREISLFLAGIQGDYVMIRRALTNENQFVKSMIKIAPPAKDRDFVRIIHTHVDRYGGARTSSGVIFPVVSNIYAILQVEDGEAVEFLALSKPIQRSFELIEGFLVSINSDREALSARVFLERFDKKNKAKWEKIGPRFDKNDPLILRDARTKERIDLILSEPISSLNPTHLGNFGVD